MTSTNSKTLSRGSDAHTLKRAALTVAALSALIAFMLLGPRTYDWKWAAVWRDGDYGSYMLGGLWVTIWISFGALVIAVVLGVLGGVARLSNNWVWNQLGTIYVELIRGTPLLVQILVAYHCFGIALRDGLEATGASASLVEVVTSAQWIGIAILGIFGGAYVSEIVRAAILSIDRGQTEAALSQGMTKSQVFRCVLLPQAIRRMIPPLTGQFVSLIKDSSLLSAIAVLEATKRASAVRASTFQQFEVYLPLAVMYLAVCFPLSRLARRLELRLAD